MAAGFKGGQGKGARGFRGLGRLGHDKSPMGFEVERLRALSTAIGTADYFPASRYSISPHTRRFMQDIMPEQRAKRNPQSLTGWGRPTADVESVFDNGKHICGDLSMRKAGTQLR
jgi:hypothetical protein